MGKAHFTGDPVTEWNEDRTMTLVESLAFIDSKGREWMAPKGSVVDGASIPRFFWRICGGPFTGRYRRASIVHDVFCVTKKTSSYATHLMFYEAMLVDKTPKWKAKWMYRAVKWFGPKW